MTGPDPKTEKADLRKRMREALKQTPAAQIAQWSARITEKLIELPEFQQAASLMVYLSFATEYQTADLIGRALAAGKTVCAPKVAWDRWQMHPVVLRSADDFVKDDHGINEPKSNQRFSLGELALVLVPGLAFDQRGRRLGRGGGFYDQLLSRTDLQAAKIAAAFDLQLVPRVPVADHDQPVDTIVTPHKLLRFVRKSSTRPASEPTGEDEPDERRQFWEVNF